MSDTGTSGWAGFWNTGRWWKAVIAVVGYIALYDADNRRAQAIILWDDRDAADAAEETLEERRRKMVDQVGLTIESVDLFEAPVVELAGARV